LVSGSFGTNAEHEAPTGTVERTRGLAHGTGTRRSRGWVEIQTGGETARMDGAKCGQVTNRVQVDFDVITSKIQRARDLSGEVRDKASAIKSIPAQPADKCGSEPCDASGQIIRGLDGIITALEEARESLQAFI